MGGRGPTQPHWPFLTYVPGGSYPCASGGFVFSVLLCFVFAMEDCLGTEVPQSSESLAVIRGQTGSQWSPAVTAAHKGKKRAGAACMLSSGKISADGPLLTLGKNQDIPMPYDRNSGRASDPPRPLAACCLVTVVAVVEAHFHVLLGASFFPTASFPEYYISVSPLSSVLPCCHTVYHLPSLS